MPQNPIAVRADMIPLGMLLADAERFRPRHGIRWSTPDVMTLLEDLIGGARRREAQFIGCMSFGGVDNSDILDGHQRLYAVGLLLQVGLGMHRVRSGLRVEIAHWVEALRRGRLLPTRPEIRKHVTARLSQLDRGQLRLFYRHLLRTTCVLWITQVAGTGATPNAS